MSSIEEIQARLMDGGLMTAESLQPYLQQWRSEQGERPDTAASDFVAWLADKELITDFQGDAILAGHSGPFMLGPYRVYEHVAPGRLGGLFRAVHEETSQPVTLKVFPKSVREDEEKVSRIGREVRILAELDHPNVARSYEVGQVGDITFMALEDLRGETLAGRLEREVRFPYEEACRIVRGIARGLDHLHKNDIVHRDLRPNHIWMSEDDVPKLIEFGAARDAYAEADEIAGERESVLDETVIRQYEYMAPEEAEDPDTADARSDIYALGCVLYHCLAGHPPFAGTSSLKLAMKHALEPPPPISSLVEGVPHAIDDTLSGMLAKKPDERFQSVEQVILALDQFAPPETEPERVSVVELNEQYLEAVSSSEPRTFSEDAVGMTPELADFFARMSRRQPAKR